MAPWATPSADFAPLLTASSAGPLAMSAFYHAAALTVDETGAHGPSTNSAAVPAAAPQGARAARSSDLGSGSAPAGAAAPAQAPAAVFQATQPFVVAITHVPSGANVLLGRVEAPLLWKERS